MEETKLWNQVKENIEKELSKREKIVFPVSSAIKSNSVNSSVGMNEETEESEVSFLFCFTE